MLIAGAALETIPHSLVKAPARPACPNGMFAQAPPARLEKDPHRPGTVRRGKDVFNQAQSTTQSKRDGRIAAPCFHFSSNQMEAFPCHVQILRSIKIFVNKIFRENRQFTTVLLGSNKCCSAAFPYEGAGGV